MLKVVISERRESLSEIRARRWGTTHEEIKQTFMRVYGGNKSTFQKVVNL
ncbi:hypothetical protein LZS85_15720 [Aliivibrio fischeri]|nr:hypothetical protein [Aliivibrio fischeri]MCE7567572.1 hypothetical protein [Aliivibrio fischeri]